MTKNLVIVESPAKARTIGRFLGRDYDVKASIGHIRDLPERTLGVDVKNDFEPKYVVPEDKKALVKELDQAVKKADALYLATDPDREGEAIAWHLSEAIKTGKKPVRRVVFHEITKPAIDAAFDHPREIDIDLVNAQQTRRILDRLVGYRLSPLLGKKVRRGLSAGRVQSVALRIIVDREREIEKFVPVEYWRILANLAKQSANSGKVKSFNAALASVKGEKGKLEVHDEQTATALVEDLRGAIYTVGSVKKRETQRRPTAPFITSTLQQEAWRKLRFSARKTMTVAQQLYEGLSLGAETMGLITYMRTDSPVVSASALAETREYVAGKYGKEYLPPRARAYAAKSKGAQEAHEAIRPTSIMRDPASVRSALSNDQFRLYDLVWKRMVASQMANAVFDATSVQVEAAGAPRTYVLTVTGSVQKFAGFLTLYAEGSDTNDEDEKEEGALPPLEKGERLDLKKLDPQQKFTQPPPRYSEASLVKALEEAGIGRPSTYAAIVSTIQNRGYVKKDNGLLQPEKLGVIVNDLLVEAFSNYIDPSFTAVMEEGLDEIARGEKGWTPYLSDFYGPFEAAVAAATETLERKPEVSDEVCDLDGKPMVIKKGRFGLFLSCTGYPECKGTKPLNKVEVKVDKALEEAYANEVCELDGKPMIVKHGRYGPFLSCTGYPECKGMKRIEKKADAPCPEDGGDLVERRNRKGRTFYGCANYPECKFLTGRRPLAEPCPSCGGLLTEAARNGARCVKCDYKGARPEPEEAPAPEREPVAAG